MEAEEISDIFDSLVELRSWGQKKSTLSMLAKIKFVSFRRVFDLRCLSYGMILTVRDDTSSDNDSSQLRWGI